MYGLILVFLLIGHGFAADDEGRTDQWFREARGKMVEDQLKARGIKDDRVLRAMAKVPRHEFVPFGLRPLAYVDGPLPIGEKQTISQPYIIALMTELIDLDGSEKVLEIGTGSGYQAAVLAELAEEVYSIEIIESLAVRADKLLRKLGYDNIKVKYGNGFMGWEEHAPFDAIIVTAAPADVPEPLIEQLVEGGKLVIPVGIGRQELKLLTKEKGKVLTRSIIPVRFVPMTGKGRKID